MFSIHLILQIRFLSNSIVCLICFGNHSSQNIIFQENSLSIIFFLSEVANRRANWWFLLLLLLQKAVSWMIWQMVCPFLFILPLQRSWWNNKYFVIVDTFFVLLLFFHINLKSSQTWLILTSYSSQGLKLVCSELVRVEIYEMSPRNWTTTKISDSGLYLDFNF